jgi:hypothetical protein
MKGSNPEELRDMIAQASIKAFNDGIRVERKRVVELMLRTVCEDYKEKHACTHPTCYVLDFKIAEVKGAYGE